MADRVFGLEAEVAFTALGRGGTRVDQRDAVSRLMDLARHRLRHLPGPNGSGMFLENGSRFYIDCGKPEITTPEVFTPDDACRYLLAGEILLKELADELVAAERDIAQVILTRCNVSYAGTRATWASHESFGHKADPRELPQHLIPHLVSRLIITGAGGFDNQSPGLEFMLSPRVAHLTQSISHESQHHRGIFHAKDESLSGPGFHRLHVLCGESVCSETALWQRMADTALVVALVEGGFRPGDEVRLADPLGAMQSFARDPTLKQTAFTENGRSVTALDIQYHYLSQVERCRDEPCMPPWTAAACSAWRRLLDRLQAGSTGVQTTLDWAIKYALFRRYAAGRGIAWESLPVWNNVLRRLSIIPPERVEAAETPMARLVRRVSQPAYLAAEKDKLAPLLADSGLRWDDLEAFYALRQELFEIDTRFGQIGEQGIFSTLERQGVLDHRVAGVIDVRRAMTEPPPHGRAHLRGVCIKRFAGSNGACYCDWNGVWNGPEQMFLDLSDPLDSTERWRSLARRESAEAVPPDPRSGRFYDMVMHDYDAGRYESANHSLTMLRELVGPDRMRTEPELVRYAAWVQARRGFLDGPRTLDQLAPHRPLDLVAICDYVCVYRFQGLAPPPEIEPWLVRGLELMNREQPHELGTAAALLGHQTFQLLCQDRCTEALAAIERASQPDWYRRAHWRVQGRLLAEHAEVLRRLGDGAGAARLLDQAETLQRDRGCPADLADLTWTRRAKLLAADQPAAARHLLRQIRRIQTTNHNLQGLVRTLLLQLRLPAGHGVPARWATAARNTVVELRDQRPALARCPLLARILSHWELWIHGEVLPGETDFFCRL